MRRKAARSMLGTKLGASNAEVLLGRKAQDCASASTNLHTNIQGGAVIPPVQATPPGISTESIPRVGDTVTISTAAANQGAFSSRLWQYAATEGGPFTTIVGETATTLVLPSETEGFIVRCVETYERDIDGDVALYDVASNWIGTIQADLSPGFEIPTITAGAGFAGATSVPADQGNTANRYGTRKVITRWIEPQYQDLTALKYVGVLADHGSGIQKVTFQLDGGTTVDVTERTTVDGVYAYYIGVDPTALSDDESRELRATVYPVDGKCVVLQGNTWTASATAETDEGVFSFWFATNSGGSLYNGSLYVDPVSGNDTTGDGSSGTPYATTMKALRQHKVLKNAAGKGNNAGGGIILMKAGSFALGSYAFPEVETPDRYVTIKPAPGVAKSAVVLTSSSNSSGLRTQRVKLEGITITPPSTSAPILSATNPLSQLSHFWIHDCTLDWTDAATAGTAWFSGPRHLAVTNCVIQNCNNAVTNPYVKLVRDTTISALIGDALSDVGCCVNVDVNDIYVSGGTHPDVYQLQQTNNANKFLYRVIADAEIDAQGIFQGGGFTTVGMAVQECTVKRAPATSWLNFSFGGTITHLVCRDCIGSDNSTTVPTAAADGLLQNCTNASSGGALLLAGDTGTLPFTGSHGFRYE